MPAKSYLFFFLGVTLLSTSLHYFVFSELRRTLKKDFGSRSPRLIRLAAILFFVMESPFVLLFFRKHITADPVIYTKFLFYPFTVWQAIMLMWFVILLPQVLYRKLQGRALTHEDSVRANEMSEGKQTPGHPSAVTPISPGSKI